MLTHPGEIYQSKLTGMQYHVILWSDITSSDRLIQLPGHKSITKAKAFSSAFSCWRQSYINDAYYNVFVFTNEDGLRKTLLQDDIELIYQPPKCILCDDHIPDLHYLCEKCRV